MDATRPGNLYRALFQTRKGTLLFGGFVLLYGIGAYLLSSSGYRLVGGDAERTVQVIGSIGLTSLLLHFYVDSFIWKVRSKEVRAALAIRSSKTPGATPPQSIAPSLAAGRSSLYQAAHAIAYFGLPILLVTAIGASNRNVSEARELGQIAHESVLFPRSAYTHFHYGRAALKAGDRSTARRELARAVDLAPSFEGRRRRISRSWTGRRGIGRLSSLTRGSLSVRSRRTGTFATSSRPRSPGRSSSPKPSPNIAR